MSRNLEPHCDWPLYRMPMSWPTALQMLWVGQSCSLSTILHLPQEIKSHKLGRGMVLTTVHQQLKAEERGGILPLAKQGLFVYASGLREDFWFLYDLLLSGSIKQTKLQNHVHTLQSVRIAFTLTDSNSFSQQFKCTFSTIKIPDDEEFLLQTLQSFLETYVQSLPTAAYYYVQFFFPGL